MQLILGNSSKSNRNIIRKTEGYRKIVITHTFNKRIICHFDLTKFWKVQILGLSNDTFNIFRGCFQLQYLSSEPMSKRDRTVTQC